MHPILKDAFHAEMLTAKKYYERGEYRDCFHHLERAHVLGQRHAWPHTVNHWWMLKVGMRLGSGREIFGQFLRLVGGGITSLLGRAPIGNTGGANVGIMTPMPIPEDLAAIFRQAGM
ncbi:MAG: DUF3703 domain-containing protein [Spirochaetes bacterium]|nr:DUF3703 domain-containing protein [Spirochaetota bacterium]MBX3720767.1 DUF3703 domain-containing protein [Turneriella sp.]